MSAFEFFFSFYGLLLGLSVAVIATGVATAIQHRKKVRIGWLTPLLATFVGLDIASFWDSAWVNFQHLSLSYGLLVGGLIIALVYFVAASLVFPHQIEDGDSLDDHFRANKKFVLLLLVAANALGTAAVVAANLGRPEGFILIFGYLFNLALYIGLIVPAAFARKPTLFAVMIGLHIALYIAIAGMSALNPDAVIDKQGRIVTPATAPQVTGGGKALGVQHKLTVAEQRDLSDARAQLVETDARIADLSAQDDAGTLTDDERGSLEGLYEGRVTLQETVDRLIAKRDAK